MAEGDPGPALVQGAGVVRGRVPEGEGGGAVGVAGGGARVVVVAEGGCVGEPREGQPRAAAPDRELLGARLGRVVVAVAGLVGGELAVTDVLEGHPGARDGAHAWGRGA